MTKSSSKRELKYEALRMFAMLLIVGAHFLSSDNWAVHTEASLQHSWFACLHNSLIMFGQVGVCLFVLISSYFLSLRTTSTRRRALGLWLHVEVYSVGLMLAYLVFERIHLLPSSETGYVTLRTAAISVFPVLGGAYWFISAFFVLTIASPYINKSLNQMPDELCCRVLGGLIFVVFIWRLINPQMSYYNDVLYLGTVYVTGYCIRRLSASLPKISFPVCLFIVAACFVCCVLGTRLFTSDLPFVSACGYGAYILIAGSGASPVLSYVAAVFIFIYVQGSESKVREQTPNSSLRDSLAIHFSLLARSCVEKFASATLGVYLIHENMFMKQLLWNRVFGGLEPVGYFSKLRFAASSVALIYVLLIGVSKLFDECAVAPLCNYVLGKVNRRKDAFN